MLNSNTYGKLKKKTGPEKGPAYRTQKGVSSTTINPLPKELKMKKKQAVKNDNEIFTISSIHETKINDCLLQYSLNYHTGVYQDVVLQDITIWEKPMEWFWEILNPDVPRFIIATNNASALPPHLVPGGGTRAHEESCLRSEPDLVAIIKENIIRTNSPVRTLSEQVPVRIHINRFN